jgi:hypothetical protein
MVAYRAQLIDGEVADPGIDYADSGYTYSGAAVDHTTRATYTTGAFIDYNEAGIDYQTGSFNYDGSVPAHPTFNEPGHTYNTTTYNYKFGAADYVPEYAQSGYAYRSSHNYNYSIEIGQYRHETWTYNQDDIAYPGTATVGGVNLIAAIFPVPPAIMGASGVIAIVGLGGFSVARPHPNVTLVVVHYHDVKLRAGV